MSESAVAVPVSVQPRMLTQLGSFTLGPRVIDTQHRLGKIAQVTATGVPDSPFAGVPSVVYCIPLGELPANQLKLATAVLARIQDLNGPTLMPVLESGIAGRVGYVAEPVITGERLSDRSAREQRLKPFAMTSIVSDVGRALEAAHAVRVSHGLIVPALVWVTESGLRQSWEDSDCQDGDRPTTGALLAGMSYELLAGGPWNHANAADLSIPETVESIRSRVHGLTEPLAGVIATAMASDPGARFPTVTDFCQALSDAVSTSAIEICAGAWEAISRDDIPMAAILTEMAAGYDPDSLEIPLLRVRLDGGTLNDLATRSRLPSFAASTMALTDIPLSEISSTANPIAPLGEPPTQSGLTFDEAELKRLFGAVDSESSPAKSNPWVIFLTVVFAMICLLTVLTALAFARS